ncbi:hypothetical protein [Actinoplanes auranticolor]|uniref:Uncharacterized protein n=1 Tax=Actinoplanes auranticolor TaxID=47988 RepID=A0A919SU68_9ACTN|nr:hypothetical protein [Actinoplanes auranticolor]GIM78029.1 hypothetical protein Aau02nite_78890 [Actinoplanes auranticolor]
MTDANTTPATDDATPTPAATVTPRKPATRKAKAPAKKEFAPKVTDSGRLDHTDCGHERTMAGRSKCRAVYKAAAAQDAK